MMPIKEYEPKEAAALLGIPRKRVLSEIKKKRLPAYRMSRKTILIRSDDLAAYKASHRV